MLPARQSMRVAVRQSLLEIDNISLEKPGKMKQATKDEIEMKVCTEKQKPGPGIRRTRRNQCGQQMNEELQVGDSQAAGVEHDSPKFHEQSEPEVSLIRKRRKCKSKAKSRGKRQKQQVLVQNEESQEILEPDFGRQFEMDFQDSEIKQEEDHKEVEIVLPEPDSKRTQIEEPAAAEVSLDSKDAHDEPISNLTTINDTKQFVVENWDVEMNPTNIEFDLKVESVPVNQTCTVEPLELVHNIRKLKLNPKFVFPSNKPDKKPRLFKKDLKTYGNIKIGSWCIDGASKLTPSVIEYIEKENFDILCLQGLKSSNQVKLEAQFKKMTKSCCAYYCLKDLNPGLVIFTKIEATTVQIVKMPEFEELSADQSVLAVEFVNFTLVCVVAPSSGFGLVHLTMKIKWHNAFRAYIAATQRKKPLLIVGNLEAAHQEIDLVQPKYRKSAGTTHEESKIVAELLELDMIDTFRFLNPDIVGISCFVEPRIIKTVGTRFDYFFASKAIQEFCKLCTVQSNVNNFIHCPIILVMNFN